MSTIGLRNQEQPDKPENPAYPSGVSPSRTQKNPDNYALRTILAGKVSFVSSYMTEGFPVTVGGRVYPSLKRVWVMTCTEEKKKGPPAGRAGLQSFVTCNTTRIFNIRYEDEVICKGGKLNEHEELKIFSRNPNYYTKPVIAKGFSRLVILYLEPTQDLFVDKFCVQVLRLNDDSLPLHFAYAQAICGRKLDQLSFEQEQRYIQALESSRLVRNMEWQEWNSKTDTERDAEVNKLLTEFNNGATIGSIR